MQLITQVDRLHLARAIELSEQGRGRVSPNPLVGAVIARENEILGEGFHGTFGGPHAEVEAIAACGDVELAGATLYVSLEPCAHEGKTPPCAQAIVAAGIERVVVACEDPSSKASGRGLAVLRDAGIEVVVDEGELASRSRALNQPFRKHAKTGRPHVLFKAAMTLDGKVATLTGDSKWISSEDSRIRAHYWRAECDAVAVGIGTALSDDPQLTARVDGVHRQPRRIVFDSEARLPLNSQLVEAARELPLTVVTSRAAQKSATVGLESAGVEVVVATGENEQARILSALDQLGEREITSILLEGGPRLAGAFLDAGEVDELRLFLAPILIGGRTARSLLEGEGSEAIANATKVLQLEVEHVAEDLLISARLKEW